MSVTLELAEKVENRLTIHAKRLGLTLPEFATQVMGRIADYSTPSETAESIDEILAPFRKQVAESGMSEDELDAFFQEVRQEVWDEQHQHGKVA